MNDFVKIKREDFNNLISEFDELLLKHRISLKSSLERTIKHLNYTIPQVQKTILQVQGTIEQCKGTDSTKLAKHKERLKRSLNDLVKARSKTQEDLAQLIGSDK